MQPDAVVLDHGPLNAWAGPTSSHRNRVRIERQPSSCGGHCQDTENFTNIPVVYTTYERAMRKPRERRTLSYVPAKAKEGVPEAELTSRIQEQTGLEPIPHKTAGRRSAGY